MPPHLELYCPTSSPWQGPQISPTFISLTSFLHSSHTLVGWEGLRPLRAPQKVSALRVSGLLAALQVVVRCGCVCRRAGEDAALQQCLCDLWWLKSSWLQRCAAPPGLKLPPARPPASPNPGLGLRPPTFSTSLHLLHPSHLLPCVSTLHMCLFTWWEEWQ